MATKKDTAADQADAAPATAEAATPVVPASLSLGKEQDPQALFEGFAQGRTYPLPVVVTNALHRPLVLSQAQPIRVIEAQGSVAHEVNTPAELYDVIFGMIAVADRLDAVTIGTITEA